MMYTDDISCRDPSQESNESIQIWGQHSTSATIRSSLTYSQHYRRMLPLLLEALTFRSNNVAHRPVIETVYVVSGSDAEAHVARRFPHKRIKRVRNGVRPASIAGFLRGLPLTFQKGQSTGLDAVYHFTFTGAEPCQTTVIIRDRTLTVHDGLVDTADLHITADSKIWLGFIAKERSIIWALMTRKIRLRGPIRLLKAFGRCSPS